jgi:predicted SAM-dependent methyltransferase
MNNVMEQVTAAIASEYGRGGDERLKHTPEFWRKLDDTERFKWLQAVRMGFAVAMAAAASSELPIESKAELAGWIESTKNNVRKGPRPEEVVAKYLEEMPQGQRGINLGSGSVAFPGWLNIDLDERHADIHWDLANGLPFLPAGEFDAAYSEHFLEHVPRKTAMEIVSDCFRALKPGGSIRLALPNLDELIRAYHADDKHPDVNESFREEMGAVFHSKGELFNIAMRAWGHTYMYNREDIELLLKHVGFVDIRAAELGQSSVALLQNRESRPAYQSSLITEATKPA